MRAAIAAQTVDGNSPLGAASVTDAPSSSRNSGLPSATDTTRSIVEGSAAGSSAVATAFESRALSASSGRVV